MPSQHLSILYQRRFSLKKATILTIKILQPVTSIHRMIMASASTKYHLRVIKMPEFKITLIKVKIRSSKIKPSQSQNESQTIQNLHINCNFKKKLFCKNNSDSNGMSGYRTSLCNKSSSIKSSSIIITINSISNNNKTRFTKKRHPTSLNCAYPSMNLISSHLIRRHRIFQPQFSMSKVNTALLFISSKVNAFKEHHIYNLRAISHSLSSKNFQFLMLPKMFRFRPKIVYLKKLKRQLAR